MGSDAATVPLERKSKAPTVSLELDSRPETLTLVRGMLGGVAELLAFDAELLDDLKTAVSEACNNVVMHAYPGGSGPLSVMLTIRACEIEVTVCDEGQGFGEEVLDDVHGVGLPVIRALSERAEFRIRAGGGTEVWMLFSGARNGKPLFALPEAAAPEDGWIKGLSGDAVVSVSPVALLPGVLGRLARALAASARFSLDRFSDVYLVCDAIAAHAAGSASADRVGFAITASARRLELSVGPFRRGSSEHLLGRESLDKARSPLALLSDEVHVSPSNDAELLRVVLVDHRDPAV